MTTDISQIETLLHEKKYDEVRALISAVAAEPFTPAEKGAALTGLASVYMDISNSINSRYLSALRTALAGLEMVSKSEQAFAEKIRASEIRSDLSQAK